MSKGDNIKIDEDDLQKLTLNIDAKLIRLKQAIINPSFMISITPTDEKEFYVERKVELRDGKAFVIEEEKVRSIKDLMGDEKLLR
jgi:hypothetical protein